MAKAKHVKLGEKASVFYDPTSGLKVTPNRAVELTKEAQISKRVIKAIKSGHLDYVHDDEMGDLEVMSVEDQQPRKTADTNKKKVEANKQKAQDQKSAASDEAEDEDEWDEKSLKRLKKDELVKMAKDNGTELSDEELEDSTKDELTSEILGLLEEGEYNTYIIYMKPLLAVLEGVY